MYLHQDLEDKRNVEALPPLTHEELKDRCMTLITSVRMVNDDLWGYSTLDYCADCIDADLQKIKDALDDLRVGGFRC
jgi:hypothetical protein